MDELNAELGVLLESLGLSGLKIVVVSSSGEARVEDVKQPDPNKGDKELKDIIFLNDVEVRLNELIENGYRAFQSKGAALELECMILQGKKQALDDEEEAFHERMSGLVRKLDKDKATARAAFAAVLCSDYRL